MLSGLLAYIFLLLVVINSANSSDVTFKNVSVWDTDGIKIVTISSSNSLKENLPTFRLGPISFKGALPVLYNNSFGNITNVNGLYLKSNEIKEIRPGTFTNSTRLNFIYLTNNNLTTIKAGVFSGLNVARLSFIDNKISALEPRAFENLPHLKMLELSKNQLQEIHADVFGNLSLESLDLGRNLISKLHPRAFKNIVKLRSLHLKENRLKEIPEGVFSNSTVQQLFLQDNEIEVIAPRAFDDMPCLQMIRISNNKLKIWDDNWFRNTPNISKVIFSHNLIKKIPSGAFKNFRDVRQVNKVDFSFNQIQDIAPDAFRGLKVLFLVLSNNSIVDWNEELSEQTDVTYLDLRDNKMQCVRGNYDKIFKAFGTLLYGNPWDPYCKSTIFNYELFKKKSEGFLCVSAYCPRYHN